MRIDDYRMIDARTASPQSTGGKKRAEILSAGQRESIASQGGKRRAEKLTAKQREDIARAGGVAKNKGA